VGVMIWTHKSIRNIIINYIYWSKRIIEVKLNIGRGKLSFFELYAPEEGRVEENEIFYDQLQNILNKTNKNDYILLSGDLNGRIGSAEIHNIVGNYGEPVTNTNGLGKKRFCHI
jgi:exonuclease III